nr:hypothetical protein [Tanacetum cinerariifolium]
MVRSMMSQITLPKSFWDYAIEYAARILNMVPTKNVDNTPYEVWHRQIPKLSYLKVWGYLKKTTGYSFYYPTENKVFVARNAEFFENDIIEQEVRMSLEDLEIIQKEDTHPSIDTSLNHKKDDQEIDEPQSDINHIRSKVHWTVVKNILKYLHNTKDMFLLYGGDTKRELRVSCYTDVGYLTDADDIKLGVVPTIEEPINMYCDNTRAIAIAKDHGVTKGARHFRAKVHYLRETIKMGDVRIEKVNTDDNLADLFTKALAFSKHSELTEKIGMIPPSSLM